MDSGMGTKSNEPIKNRSLNCEFLFTFCLQNIVELIPQKRYNIYIQKENKIAEEIKHERN